MVACVSKKPGPGQATRHGRQPDLAGRRGSPAPLVRGNLFNRKTAPRDASEFLARQLLTRPTPLRAGLASATAMTLFTELTGHDAGQWQEACGTAPAGRLVIVILRG